jgi:hypothetical protein
MKTFIAGSKDLTKIDDFIVKQLNTFMQMNYEILVGDCSGTDSLVKDFLHKNNYSNVTVYACNGKARNNIGNWQVKNIPTPSYLYGFDFYKKKDVAMIEDAEYGFMIWDGKSKGTGDNIYELLKRNTRVMIYLYNTGEHFVANNLNYLQSIFKKT